MKKYLKRAEELKESVTGNYEYSTDVQDYELVEWLIEQAKKAERYEQSLKTIIELTSCDDTWDFANRILENKTDINLSYRFNQQ